MDLGTPDQPLGRAYPARADGHGVDCAYVRHDRRRAGRRLFPRVRRGAASRARPLRPPRFGVCPADAGRGRLGAGAPRAARAPHRDHAGARGAGPRPRRAGHSRGVDGVVRRQLPGDPLVARGGARHSSSRSCRGVRYLFIGQARGADAVRPIGRAGADSRVARPPRAQGHDQPAAGRRGLDGARRRSNRSAADAPARSRWSTPSGQATRTRPVSSGRR